MIATSILLLTALLSLALGLVVFVYRPKARLNRVFCALTIWVAIWTVTNAFFPIVSSDLRLAVALVSYGAAMLLALYFALFCRAMGARKNHEKVPLALVAVGWIVAIASAVPGIIGVSVTSSLDIIANQVPLIIYMAVMVVLFGYGVGNLIVRAIRSTPERARLTSILVGVAIALIVGLACNLFMPLIGMYQFVSYGPIGTLAFIIASAYAIVRHGLFDIRAAIVRSLAYALSVIVLTAVYFGLAYGMSSLVLHTDATTGISVSPLNIILALVLALIFQPVKQFFDRVTNRIFYRDQYDTNEFITRLGRILTDATHLDEVLDHAGDQIVSTLKASSYLFLVYRDHHPDLVKGAHYRDHFDAGERQLLRELADRVGTGVLVVSDLMLYHDSTMHRIHKLLKRRHVALVLPLIASNEMVGYLMLGEQLAGGYTRHDKIVLEAIADELIIAIQNARSIEVVRELNQSLEQRVNDATKELRSSNKRLLELDATKDEFVSMASHQLRTPLTSVKGYISMVLEGDAGDISESQRQLLEEAFTSSERMVHLIGDFLNVSRLQNGKFMIDKHECDLSKVTEQEVEGVRQIAAAHNMVVTYKKPKNFPTLYIDEGKIRQVIMNFIDNAIYYSPNTSEIKVSLAVEDGEAVVRVTDKGMGVPFEVQKKLFSKFFRAENARTQRPDGTGIGLYLAKKIIDGHSGSLVFQSTEGKGSTFGFRLPIKKLSKPPAVKPEEPTDVVIQEKTPS